MNDPVAFVNALRLLGAGMAMIGAIGAGVGVGAGAGGFSSRWQATIATARTTDVKTIGSRIDISCPPL